MIKVMIKAIGEKKETSFNPRDPRKVSKYSDDVIRFIFSSKEELGAPVKDTLKN